MVYSIPLYLKARSLQMFGAHMGTYSSSVRQKTMYSKNRPWATMTSSQCTKGWSQQGRSSSPKETDLTRPGLPTFETDFDNYKEPSYCNDKTLGKSNVREERCVLAQSIRWWTPSRKRWHGHGTALSRVCPWCKGFAAWLVHTLEIGKEIALVGTEVGRSLEAHLSARRAMVSRVPELPPGPLPAVQAQTPPPHCQQPESTSSDTGTTSHFNWLENVQKKAVSLISHFS